MNFNELPIFKKLYAGLPDEFKQAFKGHRAYKAELEAYKNDAEIRRKYFWNFLYIRDSIAYWHLKEKREGKGE